MKKLTILTLAWVMFISLTMAAGGAFAGTTALSKKPLQIVGTWEGKIAINNDAGFSEETISIVIEKQPKPGYLISGKIVFNETESVIYGFIEGDELRAFGEHLSLVGEVEKKGKGQWMRVIIGNTSETPSCMASETLKKK